MTTVERPKRVAALRHELKQLRVMGYVYENAVRATRARMDEVEATLELLGAPVSGTQLGLFFTEETSHE